jgi:membrane fusion protein (multidrug efflux system)
MFLSPLFRRAVRCLVLVGAVYCLGGCGGQAKGPGQQAQVEEGRGPGSQSTQPPTPVAVEPAITGDIASYYRATATLEADKQAQILARVQGVVGSLACEEGDLVDEGQELLQIDNHEYQLRLDQARATTSNLRARYERMERMLAEELTSEEEYESAKSELATAEADEGLAALDVDYTTVTAPFRGRVTERLVDPGQNVSVGTPLFVIADFDPLLARVHVPAKEFRKLQAEQPVTLRLDSDGREMRGTIKLVSPVIDPTSGTIKLTVEIPEYPGDTRPGDFAEVSVVTELRTGTTLIPRAAVVADKGEDVVYVAADDQAERRVVEVGFTDDAHAEILSGVAPGELVVIKGQRSLKQGTLLKILEGIAENTADVDTAVANAVSGGGA